MPMLHGKLALFDVRDVEAFTAGLLQPNLNPDQREDLHAYLIAETWELSLTYRPGPRSFSAYATIILRRRTHEWKRQRNGRTIWRFSTHTYTRQIPQLTSLDDPDQPQPTPHRDPAADRDPDLARLLRTRGSDEAWRHDRNRPRLSRRAA